MSESFRPTRAELSEVFKAPRLRRSMERLFDFVPNDIEDAKLLAVLSEIVSSARASAAQDAAEQAIRLAQLLPIRDDEPQEVFLPPFAQSESALITVWGAAEISDQIAASASTAYDITLASLNGGSGVTLGANYIEVSSSGVYEVAYSLPFYRNSASANVWAWVRVNGSDATDSSLAYLHNPTERLMVSRTTILELNTGDQVGLAWATDNTGVQIDAIAATSFAPKVTGELSVIMRGIE